MIMRELFKLLYMSPREKREVPAVTAQWNRAVSLVRDGVGLEEERATLFHLEMWVFVHGIASMVAMESLSFDEELISTMLTDAYQGLSRRFNGGEND